VLVRLFAGGTSIPGKGSLFAQTGVRIRHHQWRNPLAYFGAHFLSTPAAYARELTLSICSKLKSRFYNFSCSQRSRCPVLIAQVSHSQLIVEQPQPKTHRRPRHIVQTYPGHGWQACQRRQEGPGASALDRIPIKSARARKPAAVEEQRDAFLVRF
jgi:hypothetical protein